MWGEPPVTSGFLSQRASNAENVSIWWRHHVSAACSVRSTIHKSTMPLSHIPQCSIQNRNAHISALNGIVGNRTGALWELWIWDAMSLWDNFKYIFKTLIFHFISKCKRPLNALLIMNTVYWCIVSKYKSSENLLLDAKYLFMFGIEYQLAISLKVHGHRKYALQWRHNESQGVSNHRCLECLLNHLFKRKSNKTLKLHVTGLCEGNSPVTGEFPAQGPVTRKIFLFDDVLIRREPISMVVDCGQP